MKKILITGSCGFVFSNFIRNATANKCEFKIISVDKVINEKNLHNIYANKSHEFHVGDIADPHFVDILFKITQPDIVIHGATEIPVESSSSFITSNILGTHVIANACIKYKVEKLIYTSTYEVYGQHQDENQNPWMEESLIQPRSYYATSKAAGEMIVKTANYNSGLQYNIVRLCNIFGPRQSANYLIPKIIGNILNKKPIPIYDQGKQIREWLYVSDIYSALMTIINKGESNQVYNVSSSYEFSNLELCQKICNEMETGHDLISFLKDKNNQDFRHACDSSKIRELGWKPQMKMGDGLNQTISWFQNNSWWFN